MHLTALAQFDEVSHTGILLLDKFGFIAKNTFNRHRLLDIYFIQHHQKIALN